MTEKEINAAFANFDPQHPFYLAVLAILDNVVLTEQESAVVPDLGDGARHYNAGRLGMAMAIRGLLPDTMREAMAQRIREEMKAQERAARAQAAD